jgi:hypothetical protein
MSAAQLHALPYTEQPLNEAEALYRIGHQAVVASNLEATVESILALGLRVAGVIGIAIEPLPGCGWTYRQVDTASTSASQGTAVADIAAEAAIGERYVSTFRYRKMAWKAHFDSPASSANR